MSSRASPEAVGALEIQSFFSDPKHGNQARTIAAAILPSVASHQEFDAAFFTLVQSTNQTNQQVIAIASNLSNKIGALHETALKHLKDNPNPADKSLENFVLNPDKFFSDDEQSDYLAQTYESTWKLDSAMGFEFDMARQQEYPSGVPG